MRFRIEFCPRASWVNGVEPADQRWSRTPNVFTGTLEQATLECSELDSAYDFACTFRAVPLEPTPEELAYHFCPRCGGDHRDAPGTEYACSCPREQTVDRWGGMAWTRETVTMSPGEETAS